MTGLWSGRLRKCKWSIDLRTGAFLLSVSILVWGRYKGTPANSFEVLSQLSKNTPDAHWGYSSPFLQDENLLQRCMVWHQWFLSVFIFLHAAMILIILIWKTVVAPSSAWIISSSLSTLWVKLISTMRTSLFGLLIGFSTLVSYLII